MERLWDRELRHAAFLDHDLDRGKAEPVHLLGRFFESVDFGRAEGIACSLVPVDAVHRVIAEARRLAALPPVGAGHGILAAHQPPEDVEWELEPKPLRLTELLLEPLPEDARAPLAMCVTPPLPARAASIAFGLARGRPLG